MWPFWARPEQLAPAGDWFAWLILAGRGFGKTRSGAEFVRDEVRAGRAGRIALVAKTAADVRDVMVQGESGLLAISPKHERPEYHPSTRSLRWPNGAIATTYSSEEPDQLRGPQHDLAWADELAAWRYRDAWDQLALGLRLGARPRVVATTTPRPTPVIRDLVKQAATGRVAVTRGSTFDNSANLAESFLSEIRARYDGTRLGRQELYAEVLDDTPGALWTRLLLEAAFEREAPTLPRVVVALDPSVAADGGGDEAGILVGGIDGPLPKALAHVVADYSGQYSPDAWARKAVWAYDTHKADVLVAEANNGGALVESVIKTVDSRVRVKLVHASKGKQARAEPIAALYEQGRVRHVGALARLEDEMCTWAGLTGEPSPNRVDALVWLLTELMLHDVAPTRIRTATAAARPIHG